MKNIGYKTTFIITLLSLLGMAPLWSQQYSFEKGNVSFAVPTPVRTLSATDSALTAEFQATTGSLSFQVAVKTLHFNTAILPDKANNTGTKRLQEYYLESEQYPYASFKGNMRNRKEVNFSKDGTYTAKVDGMATIHGVTRKVTLDFKFTSKGDRLLIEAAQSVKTADYNIRKPESVANVFFDEVTVQLNAIFKKKV